MGGWAQTDVAPLLLPASFGRPSPWPAAATARALPPMPCMPLPPPLRSRWCRCQPQHVEQEAQLLPLLRGGLPLLAGAFGAIRETAVGEAGMRW